MTHASKDREQLISQVSDPHPGYDCGGTCAVHNLCAANLVAQRQTRTSYTPVPELGRPPCPITRRPWFMDLDHPELGLVATFGGPFDSYTIPEVDDDGALRCERYDHDAGDWVEGGEPLGIYLTTEQPDNEHLPPFLAKHLQPDFPSKKESGS